MLRVPFERATIAAYFALSICVSRWLVSLTSVPHQTFIRVTGGASSGSFPYSAARLHCSLRLRGTQQRRCYSADWRALDSESVRFHLRWVNLIRGPLAPLRRTTAYVHGSASLTRFYRPLCQKQTWRTHPICLRQQSDPGLVRCIREGCGCFLLQNWAICLHRIRLTKQRKGTS